MSTLAKLYYAVFDTVIKRHFVHNLLLVPLSVHHHHNRFTALFPGPPGWAGARRELLDFMVQGKINRGRHTDHPTGRHSIRTNQCPPPPSSPYFLQAVCPSCHPTNSVKALKANDCTKCCTNNGKCHYRYNMPFFHLLIIYIFKYELTAKQTGHCTTMYQLSSTTLVPTLWWSTA